MRASLLTCSRRPRPCSTRKRPGMSPWYAALSSTSAARYNPKGATWKDVRRGAGKSGRLRRSTKPSSPNSGTGLAWTGRGDTVAMLHWLSSFGGQEVAMRRRICAAILLAGLVSALPIAGLAADANNNHDGYSFLIGTGEPGPEGPDVAAAQNGSTVTVVGEGSFKAGPDQDAGGSGTYTVKDAQGSTTSSGTWA